ncbi:8-amino-7-oxononanoate synthase [Kozakia baliensis]|uniref:aminotransferase class I/II-fold pyridoxal phosphate-dependent enzyme n=1 Tax=Kozakia baliensis TaxID=153496 RepID=UPI00345B9A0E
MTRFDPYFQQALDDLTARGLRRSLRPLSGRAGNFHRGGAPLLDFSSNDYLGLAFHPILRDRAADWAQRYGAGARASRLVSGTLEAHRQVEEKLAHFKQTEAALIFASGWQANAAIVPALLGLSKTQTGHPALVFTDRLNHASLHHGCAAAGVHQIRFRHNDLAHLEEQLVRRADLPGLRFILTESVFSMDGDRADIAALQALADRYNAFLYLDEAHATGVLGPEGRGLSCGHGVDLVMGTFSKALGGMGAYVAGSRALCDWLVNVCSGFIYSTAPSPPMLGAMDAALDIVPGMNAERAALQARAQFLRAKLHEDGWETGPSSTQIVPVMIGETQRALAIATALEERGMLAIAIRPPTVPQGGARLRLALNATHHESDIEKLVRNIAAVSREKIS